MPIDLHHQALYNGGHYEFDKRRPAGIRAIFAESEQRTDERFDGVAKQIAGMRSQIDNVTSAVRTLEVDRSLERRSIQRLENHLDGISAKLLEHDEQFAVMGDRFDAVDARFEKVDEQFQKVDAKIDEKIDGVRSDIRTEVGKAKAEILESIEKIESMSIEDSGAVAKDLEDHERRIVKLERAAA